MAQENEQPFIDLHDAIAPAFLSGRGIVRISTHMPDTAIVLAIRQALAYGKPFTVVPASRETPGERS